MADEKLLRQILAERYGIKTNAELHEAIARMEKLDISWATRCCNDESGGKAYCGRASRTKAQ